jgi:hypothetical protein
MPARRCNWSSGSCSCRWVSRALPSIWLAWFKVMPVKANNNMPTRHTAELIQCHWCRVRNQKPRLAALRLLEGEEVAGTQQ